jgi:putative SOS response-associated peptidase YedK
MCYHKSLVAKYEHLMDYYSASFESITEEVGLIKERFSILMEKENQHETYSKEELAEMKWCQKTLQSFSDKRYSRYHENGFDYLSMPIITAGAPDQFKLFRWGLIPFYMGDKQKAFSLRPSTLNCISEEMYDKPSFKDAAKNSQRCLIPVSGFYEWKWLDEKGKTKIPYYISVQSQSLISIAGLYSRWKEKTSDTYYYTYTVLTTRANSLMENIHNSKKRMPVIIPREYEHDWLNRNLSKDDVLALCQPFEKQPMNAYTISKLITTKEADTNVEEVLKVFDYENENSK